MNSRALNKFGELLPLVFLFFFLYYTVQKIYFASEIFLSPTLNQVLLSGQVVLAVLMWVWPRFIVFLFWLAIHFFISYKTTYLTSPESGIFNWCLISILFCQIPQYKSDPEKLRWFSAASWLVLGLIYLNSGIGKLNDPYWHSGEALRMAMQGVFSSSFGRSISSSVPQDVLIFANYWTVGFQILFFTFFISRQWRTFLFVNAIAMHLMTLICFELYQVSIGMILAHLFGLMGWSKLNELLKLRLIHSPEKNF